MTNEELVARIKVGIDIADNMLQLWQQCKEFMGLATRHYQGQAEREDIEQEGYLALYDAVEAYRHNGLRLFNRTWESSTEGAALKLLEKSR